MEHLSTFAYVDTKLRSSNKTYSKLNTKKGKKNLPCNKIYTVNSPEISWGIKFISMYLQLSV